MLKRLCKVEWGIAIRKKGVSALYESDCQREAFFAIKNTIRYWQADPFLITYEGKKFLFFELYDRLKRKGLIGCRELRNGKVGKLMKVFEIHSHLSYPFVFVDNNELYIVPESNSCRKLLLLKKQKNSMRFAVEKELLDDVALADATFINQNGEQFMVATKVTNSDNSENLYMYQYENGWHQANEKPVVFGKDVARMAGKFIQIHDGIIRCSQDCSGGYGSGLNFSKVTNLSPDDYQEQLIRKILPSDIFISGVKAFDGIHTYNADDEYEVIDYKISYKFSLIEILGYVLERFHIIRK